VRQLTFWHAFIPTGKSCKRHSVFWLKNFVLWGWIKQALILGEHAVGNQDTQGCLETKQGIWNLGYILFPTEHCSLFVSTKIECMYTKATVFNNFRVRENVE